MLLISVTYLLTLIFTAHANANTSCGDAATHVTAKKYKTIHGHRMAYIEIGTGDPIVFLHGNPTSSYLWRNVLPHVEGHGRLIAPDLMGMGDSDKLRNSNPDRYSFAQQANFLYALLDTLGVKENVTFVVHDWGSVLGFNWAYLHRRNPRAVHALIFMEAIVHPMNSSHPAVSPQLVQYFKTLRGPSGLHSILTDNAFIEISLPQAILRNLTVAELCEYRRPFVTPGEDRRVMLQWARQFPLDGKPPSVTRIVRRYARWLRMSNIPKLFFNVEPGSPITVAFADFIRTWPNVVEIGPVAGRHFVQEDSPHVIGRNISRWLASIS